ncbi:hypothetical protein FRC02_006371 [Tulasnella sp. 418]|nr:hypothetical protein FRC02_006371 [Tulasnella sp. 418]
MTDFVQVTRWTDTHDDELTLDLISELLDAIPDDLWVTAACVDRVVDELPIQRKLIQTGLSRTENAVKTAKEAVELASNPKEDGSTPAEVDFDDGTNDLLALRKVLLQRSDRVETYATMARQGQWRFHSAEPESPISKETSPDPYAELDPWAELENEAQPQQPITPTSNVQPPLSLSSFILDPLIQTALFFATTQRFESLKTLIEQHSKELTPHRFRILHAIPDHVDPSHFIFLLPKLDFATNKEALSVHAPWRTIQDWVETEAAAPLIAKSTLELPQLKPSDVPPTEPLSAEALSSWYKDRIRRIESQSGLVDMALSFVQHGASQGIPELDKLGEELSLFSRLVYDVERDDMIDEVDQWNLDTWRGLDTSAVVQSYLVSSTPDTIAVDIRKLVLPYLYVLEARAERSGTPDPSIPTRHLYEYILSAPLHIAAAIFAESKPTLPQSSRIIKDEEDLARIALACLYGSDSLDEWSTMSQIFECMPEWANIDREADNDSEAADTTLLSLASYVTPSTNRGPATPLELFVFFKPLPASSLSRALDVLDVHLESGEIFNKWGVPAPLRWFLQTANDEKEQRAWATRMARRSGVTEEMEDEEEWLDLLHDMKRLVKAEDSAVKGAFGRLDKPTVVQIFFGGMLSSGRFQLAKKLLNPRTSTRPLSVKAVEELCLATSREFYDNAQSGNFNFGEMKLAYDCLSVAHPSPAINAEKEFIEATSKICSYGVQSRPGVPLLPIEIRLVKDRLTLIAKVISSNPDVYKHSEVVLDIVHKLGFRGDVAAEVKALAMLADGATQAEDFERAAETCERMVGVAKKLKQTVFPSSSSVLSPSVVGDEEGLDQSVINARDAIEVCWHTCFQLGRQPEYKDTKKKLKLLGYALELCPSENAMDVLNVWRRVEGDLMSSVRAARNSRGPARQRTRKGVLNNVKSGGRRDYGAALQSAAGRLPSLSSHLLSMPPAHSMTSDAAAAMASRTLNRVAGVAANFKSPFGLRDKLGLGGGISGDDASDTSSQGATGDGFGFGSPAGGFSSFIGRPSSSQGGAGDGFSFGSPGTFSSFIGRPSSANRTRAGDGRGSPTMGSEVSSQAKTAFARGVGWLIGADDDVSG